MMEHSSNYIPIDLFNEYSNPEIFIESIIDDREGFRIILELSTKSETEYFRLTFGRVLAYQNTDEYFIDNLDQPKGFSFKGGFLYEVKNSKYVQYFNYRGSNRLYENAKHYFLMTGLDCIDILTEHEIKLEQL